MNTNHNPHRTPGGRSRRAAGRFDKALADLADAGRGHGAEAAAWWQQDVLGGRAAGDVTATAARVLSGLDNLEPRVLDTLPTAAPGDALIEQIYTEHTGRGAPAWSRLKPSQRVQAVDAYRHGYEDALHQQIETYCRQVLATDPPGTDPSVDGGPAQPGGAR